MIIGFGFTVIGFSAVIWWLILRCYQLKAELQTARSLIGIMIHNEMDNRRKEFASDITFDESANLTPQWVEMETLGDEH